MYSDNIKFGEQPDDIYYHVEQLEGDIQWYREEFLRYREELENLKSFRPFLDKFGSILMDVNKRLVDLETYIHGPTRKPYDWEKKQ